MREVTTGEAVMGAGPWAVGATEEGTVVVVELVVVRAEAEVLAVTRGVVATGKVARWVTGEVAKWVMEVAAEMAACTPCSRRRQAMYTCHALLSIGMRFLPCTAAYRGVAVVLAELAVAAELASATGYVGMAAKGKEVAEADGTEVETAKVAEATAAELWATGPLVVWAGPRVECAAALWACVRPTVAYTRVDGGQKNLQICTPALVCTSCVNRGNQMMAGTTLGTVRNPPQNCTRASSSTRCRCVSGVAPTRSAQVEAAVERQARTTCNRSALGTRTSRFRV